MGCVVNREKFERKIGAKIDSFSENYVYYYKEGDPNTKMKMRLEDACRISVKEEEAVKE